MALSLPAVPASYGATPAAFDDVEAGSYVEMADVSSRRRRAAAFGASFALLMLALSAAGKHMVNSPSKTTSLHQAAPLASVHKAADFAEATAAPTTAPDDASGANRVEFCLQQNCNGQMAALAMQYNDPSAKVLTSCIEDAQTNKTAALDCFAASGEPTDQKVALLKCSGCKDCLPVDVDAATCAAMPAGWGGYAGAGAGGDWASKYMPATTPGAPPSPAGGYGGDWSKWMPGGGGGGAGSGAATPGAPVAPAGGYGGDWSKWMPGGGGAAGGAAVGAPAAGGYGDWAKWVPSAAAPAPASLVEVFSPTSAPTVAPSPAPTPAPTPLDAFQCLEDSCSKQIAGLGMAWSDRCSTVLMDCLHAPGLDKTGATACLSAAAAAKDANANVKDTANCGGCHGCADIDVEDSVCAVIPTWYSPPAANGAATTGGTAAGSGFDWSQFMPGGKAAAGPAAGSAAAAPADGTAAAPPAAVPSWQHWIP